jgi:hypothetical protein
MEVVSNRVKGVAMFFLSFFLSLLCLISTFSIEAQEPERYHQFRAKKMDKFVKKHAESEAKKNKLAGKKKKKAAKKVEVAVVAEPEEIEVVEEVDADAVVESVARSYRKAEDKHEKKEHKERVKAASKSGNSYVAPECYAAPAWPLYATRFEKGDYMRGSVQYQHVENMYDSSGSNRDVSALYFGQRDISFKDVFLVSQLAVDRKVKPIQLPKTAASGTTPADYSNNAFVYLADKKIIFKALQDRVVAPISYTRHFWNNTVALGVIIPVVYQQNSLKYQFENIDDLKNKFAGMGDIIGGNFGSDAQAFLEYLLKEKGFDAAQKNMSKTGLGDLSVFLQWTLKESEYQYVNIGARLTLPTSLQQDVSLLWGPQLDEGYPMFSGYMTALFTKHPVINPHLFLQVSVAAPVNHLMRVARTVSYNGSNNNESKAFWQKALAGSEYVEEMGNPPVSTTNFESFSDLNSTISPLAESFRDVRIAPGASFEASFGNMFNNIGLDGLAFDVWYNLYVKGSDSIQENGYESGDWSFVDLAENTNVIRHFVGAQVSYQIKNFRMYIDGGYVIAGRNTPATISAQLGLSVEF